MNREATIAATQARIEVASGVPPVSAQVVGVRLELLRIQAATRVPLPAGERLGKGCEVLLNSVCWSNNSPIPLSAMVDQLLVVGELPEYEQLSFGLGGMPVPGEATFAMELPSFYPVSEFRGQPVQQQVWIKSANRLVLPAIGPEFFAALGLPEDAQAATEVLVAALVQERLRAVEARGSELVIATLAQRLGVVPEVPSTRAHATELWKSTDEPRLVGLGLDDPARRRAQLAWNSSPGILDWASRQLMASAVISALVEAGVLDPKAIAAEADALLRQVGVGAEEAAHASQAQAASLFGTAAALAARRQVMRLPCVHITDR
jgi:hypothetical protein